MRQHRVISIAACMLLVSLVRAEAPKETDKPKEGPVGTILREVWNEIDGGGISDLTSNEDFPIWPSSSSQLSLFEGPTNSGESYGARVRGFIHPPATGAYTFYIATDDAGELWLSTTDSPKDKVKIAWINDWCPPRDWGHSPDQKSKPITLTAGKTYYIEALHKQGAGGDNLAVGWDLPDGKQERPIPGSRLSPVVPPPAPPRAAKPPPPPPVKQGHFKLSFEAKVKDQTIKIPYLLYLPKNYDTSKEPWPLLVFFHGAGECGTNLQAMYIHGPSAELQRNEKMKDNFPFIVLSPQCTPGRRWDDPGGCTDPEPNVMNKAVVQLIDDVSKNFRVDKDRVYATGLSMGGRMTWLTAEEAPDRFAAIAPISAIAIGKNTAGEKLKNVAVWIICGADDGGFTEGSKEMYGILKKTAKADLDIMVFPHEGHGVWGRYYPDMKFYEWLLKHKRQH